MHGRKVGPPPLRKVSGTIDVIGSSRADSRRSAQEFREMVAASEHGL